MILGFVRLQYLSNPFNLFIKHCHPLCIFFFRFYSEKPSLWHTEDGLSETQIHISSGCEGEANQVIGIWGTSHLLCVSVGVCSAAYRKLQVAKALKRFVGCELNAPALSVSEFSGPGLWSFSITSVMPQKMIWCMCCSILWRWVIRLESYKVNASSSLWGFWAIMH